MKKERTKEWNKERKGKQLIVWENETNQNEIMEKLEKRTKWIKLVRNYERIK